MRFYRKKVAVTAPSPSPRFKALFRWLPSHNRNRKNCGPLIKATKNGGSHPTVSFTPALVLMTKEKKALSKAGGWRYPSIKGHARPMFNLLFFRRFTLTGYFVAVGRIELPLVEYVAIVSQPSQPLCH